MTQDKKNIMNCSPVDLDRFREEQRHLLTSQTYYMFIIASVLYPCFSILDWITAPEHALLFLYIRIAVGVYFILGALLLKFPIGKKMVLPISLWGPYLSVLGVAIMTTYLDGFFSTYYVGIVLIIFVPGLFLPWNLIPTLVFGFFSIATYFILNLTVGYPPSMTLMAVAGPFFFMTGSFTFMAFANLENEKNRRRDFIQRMQIEKSNEDLKEMDKTKMRFFSNVSHELRTPLTLILGPLEQLLHSWNDMDPVPSLRAMEANAHRLLRQVNTILDFAKADAGKLTCHYKTGNLGGILSELVQATIPYSRQKNIQITISGADQIPDSIMDVEKVETIAANLISNALKFTPDKGEINISTGKDKQLVWFEILDTGIGIPEKKIQDIFERFLQVDDQHSRSNEGTGLGLAMVRELVTLHDGKITVQSELGKGSVFRVELPVKPSSKIDRRETPGRRKVDKISEARIEALAYNEYKERVNINNKTLLADVVNGTGLGESLPDEIKDNKKKAPIDARKILVVEDNRDLRAFIVSTLVDTYHVEQAENGRKGLDLARRVNPDLILSDVMMPEMDGYELCRQIRKDQSLSKVPIILVTSKSGGEAVETGLETGANDYVPKPFEMRELKARIATQLNNRFLEKNITERDTRLTAIGQMTSSVIHDLRNPLNSIMGFTQLAQLDSKKLGNEAIPMSLDRIMEEGRRLDRMITEILDFARGSVPQLSAQSTLLIPFLETALKHHVIKLAVMKISLSFQHELCDDIHVVFDHDQIHRVIDNLINNAKESFFTRNHEVDEKKIWVMVKCENDHAIIRFSDNGPGIPEDIKDSLFDPFTTIGKKSGTGLGLATARNIVSAHSGEINVESKGPEGGAVFELKFPISISEP